MAPSSASSRHLALIGSYGSPDVDRIHVVAVDEGGFHLEWLGGFSGLRNPSFVVVHPRGLLAFAVSEVGLGPDGTLGEVHAFRIDHCGGSVDLVPLNHRSTMGDHPCHLRIDPSGWWLVAVNYGSGDVVVFPIDGGGELGDPRTRIQHVGSSVDPGRQQGPHPHSSVFSPDGRFLIVADLGIDQLVVYAFDDQSGALAPHGQFRSRPGSGPRHLAFHPNGEFLFVVNELDSTASVLGWHSEEGMLREVRTVSTLPAGADAVNLAADVHVARSGSHLHVSNRGHDSIATFAFDFAGRLGPVTTRPSGGKWPRGFGIASGGGSLIVANEHSDSVGLLPSGDSGHDRVDVAATIEVSRPTCVAMVAGTAGRREESYPTR